ncbi:MAG: hypothetical protein M1117_00420 [Candidatus Thermoplasmatota archaeon]|uniref:Uncharacterized protein n=1 Tax=Candidatus Sysuiplasma superficiale TaxID=2823368 RepID=A0A8J7YUV9_9ARCH|nr:hypothetical protein [Candidatus Sysuiplasma superficiale]MCL4346365.1 hypothetical protein [Candidatus Thermoplasmatota archaeon]
MKALNSDSIIEAIRELRRWETKTADIESRLKALKLRKSELKEHIRSLELMLNSYEYSSADRVKSSTQRFDGVR